MPDWPSRISAWPVCSQGGYNDFFRSQARVASSEGLYRVQETLELLAQILRGFSIAADGVVGSKSDK